MLASVSGGEFIQRSACHSGGVMPINAAVGSFAGVVAAAAGAGFVAGLVGSGVGGVPQAASASEVARRLGCTTFTLARSTAGCRGAFRELFVPELQALT